MNADAIECIESAFAALASGEVVMPPILSMAIEEFNGDVELKTAYVPGLKLCNKNVAGFFRQSEGGFAEHVRFDGAVCARTGMLEAVLLDNGYLTDIRTAAAGAVAARYLARTDAERVCIVGAGRQSRLQLEALCLVRPIQSAVVWARNHDRGKSAALELSENLGVSVTFGSHLKKAISSADIVVTTTPSADPLVMADWLCAGQHITSMGSDQAHKNELDPGCFSVVDRYVPDRRSQTEKLGELHHALEAGTASADSIFPELGDIVAGKAKRRESDEEITLCDLTGTGVQDTAIATFARMRAEAVSAGIDIEV